jgi:hypothetical protein
MRTRHCCFDALVAVTLLLALPQGTKSQMQPRLEQELVWSTTGKEILAPQFSVDGKLIVLATRGYVPDGAEAEGLPDSFFKKLEAKEKANPRFADPVIKVVNLKGEVVCEVRYGWNPSLSRDGKRVVFSEQVKPITGYRALASPMAGNAIRMYDCETKQITKIADPQLGYLDTPFFSPDGRSIIYTENAAVNGAYGGAVGIARYDLDQNRALDLVSKKEVTSGFPQIVYRVSPVGNEVVALLGMPIPASGDMYMAKDYDMSLISIFPLRKTILPLGKRSADSWDETNFQPVTDERILIYSKYWKLFSLLTGGLMSNPGPRNTKRESIYSRDLKYYLCAEPEGEPNHLVLYRTSDGKRLEILPKMALTYEASWSPDSKEFVIIGVPMVGASPVHHIEQMIVYSVH